MAQNPRRPVENALGQHQAIIPARLPASDACSEAGGPCLPAAIPGAPPERANIALGTFAPPSPHGRHRPPETGRDSIPRKGCPVRSSQRISSNCLRLSSLCLANSIAHLLLLLMAAFVTVFPPHYPAPRRL